MFKKISWILLALLAMSVMMRQPIFSEGESQPLTRWIVPPSSQAGQQTEQLLYKNGATLWRYRYLPGKPSGLAQPVSLADFREIRLSLLSAQRTVLVIVHHDRDGASFHYAFPIPAGQEINIAVRPSDFVPDGNSSVKKERLDPERAGSFFFLADPNPMKHEGENTIRIESASVAYAPIPAQTGDLIVDAPLIISESSERDGDIILKPGGRLLITASRFVLRGNVRCNGGTLEISGGTVVIPEHFMYEHSLRFIRGTLKIQDAALDATGFPISLDMHGSSLLARNASFSPMVTLSPDERGKIILDHVERFGEMVVPPGEDVTVQDSQVKLWLVVSRNVRGDLTLPESGDVENWSAGHGLNLTVRHSQVAFAVVSAPGSNAVIKDSHLASVALFIPGDKKVSFRDIQNGAMLQDYELPAPDRRLHFQNSRVDTWGFYPGDHAYLKVSHSTFGEAITSGGAVMEIHDSVCDGSQGYVGADDSSRIRLVNTTITTQVIAREHGIIILENCRVKGDVVATDNATIKLVNTPVEGKIEKEKEAKILQ